MEKLLVRKESESFERMVIVSKGFEEEKLLVLYGLDFWRISRSFCSPVQPFFSAYVRMTGD